VPGGAASCGAERAWGETEWLKERNGRSSGTASLDGVRLTCGQRFAMRTVDEWDGCVGEDDWRRGRTAWVGDRLRARRMRPSVCWRNETPHRRGNGSLVVTGLLGNGAPADGCWQCHPLAAW
jgi:hypothetical protein